MQGSGEVASGGKCIRIDRGGPCEEISRVSPWKMPVRLQKIDHVACPTRRSAQYFRTEGRKMAMIETTIMIPLMGRRKKMVQSF
jgi:hypothetical protein